jgi:hypothetical protein
MFYHYTIIYIFWYISPIYQKIKLISLCIFFFLLNKKEENSFFYYRKIEKISLFFLSFSILIILIWSLFAFISNIFYTRTLSQVCAFFCTKIVRYILRGVLLSCLRFILIFLIKQIKWEIKNYVFYCKHNKLYFFNKQTNKVEAQSLCVSYRLVYFLSLSLSL